ncbi:MAG: bifunctional 4-hydroxy-2-oxoglutarate aldolase/2-dehydro-3-deoxy-phosphogluconate aldolase [Planctomycetes bacterium]|nr:bifunctional 4-hydroxy-2-oxoglutarate aldolase/2-dehydro-3-deoxy-phosphogluconate aldolase [Planctomycetota bacterium]
MDDSDAVMSRIEALGIVPVVSLDDAEQAVPLADALCDGGLPIAEITFRTDAALAAIERLAGHRDLLVGAGSVATVGQAHDALDAGAGFVVSPGLDPDVVHACQRRGAPVLPGVATPTEIMQARALGLQVVKLFPADLLGGVRAVKALGAPFPGLRFVPTGGVGPGNLADWLAEPRVLAVGGSFMVAPELVRAARFDDVRRLCADAVAVRTRVRGR